MREKRERLVHQVWAEAGGTSPVWSTCSHQWREQEQEQEQQQQEEERHWAQIPGSASLSLPPVEVC